MKFQATVIEPEFRVPSLDRLDERNAPSLQFSAVCEQCGKTCACPSPSEAQAIAAALALNWKYKIPEGFKLEGLFGADDLTHAEGQVFCPRCSLDQGEEP